MDTGIENEIRMVHLAEQKIDNLLNLAMDATPEERGKSENKIELINYGL